MEAAACGRAMIASDVPGCREIVVHEKTGLLVPLDNVLALADAMERLGADPQLRARYATAARGRVVNEFSASIISRQTVALYESILGRA
jgi:glycosyltransferase involved in cell wall biosynthesis